MTHNLIDYVCAGILHDIKQTQDSEFLVSRSVSGFVSRIKVQLGAEISPAIVEGALRFLVERDACAVISDPFTSDYFLLDEGRCDKIYLDLSADINTPYGKSLKLGSVWIKEALKSVSKISQNNDYVEQFFIPAADREVKIGDNSKYRDKLQEAIGSTIALVEKNNQASELLGDSKDRVVAELRAGNELVKSPTVRVRAIFEILIKPLRYIAEKMGDGALGEAAKQLIKLLFEAIH
jgi:hypothetical protein